MRPKLLKTQPSPTWILSQIKFKIFLKVNEVNKKNKKNKPPNPTPTDPTSMAYEPSPS